MLKDIYGQRNLIETLDIWDMQLAEYGKKILERRKQFIKQVNDIIADIHYKLTGGKERITLTYESSLGNITFETALSKYRERDLRMKSTTVGSAQRRYLFYDRCGTGYSEIRFAGTAKNSGFIAEII